MVDVCAAVVSVGDVASIQRKSDGAELRKRSLVLKDDSNATIEMTLWGAAADNIGQQVQDCYHQGPTPVLCIKNAKVGDYNGRTLGSIASTAIQISPTDVTEVNQLRQWLQSGGMEAAGQALTGGGGGAAGGRFNRRTTCQAAADMYGAPGGQAPNYVLATVITINQKSSGEPPVYRACNRDVPNSVSASRPAAQGGSSCSVSHGQFSGFCALFQAGTGTRKCNKKLEERGNNTYYCPSCMQEMPLNFR